MHTNALDEAIALPTDFSARIARNTQIVIQEETGMTKVVDPLGGSYYVESLTQSLVDGAWEIIERVQAEGGMAKAVAAGWPKAMIEEASAARAARVDRGEDVIVGVNKYRKEGEDPIDILDVDNVAVREAQIAAYPAGEGDARSSRHAMRRWTRCARVRRARATCSRSRSMRRARGRRWARSSSAMEDVFGRYGTQPTPVSGLYGGAYTDDARWTRLERGRRGDRAAARAQAADAGRQDGAGRA